MAPSSRSLHRVFESVAAALLLVTIGACSEDPRFDPVPPGETEPVQSVGGGDGDEVGDESDTGSELDLPGCDPFGDPAIECGAAMSCDPSTRECVPALGEATLGDPCLSRGGTDECAPGLSCAEGRCRSVCSSTLTDPDAPGGCPNESVCALVDATWGVCLEGCQLSLQDCNFPGEACNRVVDPEGQNVACTSNPGVAAEGTGCTQDSECLAGLLCTEAALHSLGCLDGAAKCCTFACDSLELPCIGAEPVCYTLGILDQEDAGFCGAG